MKAKLNETYDDHEEEINSRLLNPVYAVNTDLQIEYDALQEQLSKMDNITYGSKDDKLTSVLSNISLLIKVSEEKGRAEEANQLRLYMMQCMQQTFSIFKDYMGIDPNSNSISLAEDLLFTEGRELLQAMYEFLIVFRYENICNLIYNLIEDHLQDIIAELKPAGDRKDLSLKTERKKLKNPGVALVLNKMEDVIHEILCGKYEIEDPITEITKGLEDNWHNAVMLENFDTVNLQLLSTKYFGDLFTLKDESEVFPMIVMEIRSKFIKNYSKQG